MERIAIISDVHANKSALEAVLRDIHSRNISRIICLGDSITKCTHPDFVVDELKKNCAVILKGNCDETICVPSATGKNFWSRVKIGEERANYLYNLPVSYEFYLSGHLVRLFHASPFGLSTIYNPMFSNNIDNSHYSPSELKTPMDLFSNTSFIGKTENDPIPDIIGYGHIHTSNFFRFKNKTIFNPGSVGIPIEMENIDKFDKTNCFSTVASYTILEGVVGLEVLAPIAINMVRVPYNLEQEILDLENSNMPGKEKTIFCLKTASPNF